MLKPPKLYETKMERNPAGAVLLLPELLETILLHVDMHTLLMSQRVCCVWYKVITGSKALQQALFLRAIEPTHVLYCQRTRNPLLEQIIWPRFIDPDWRVQDARNLESFNRPSASWRRMLFQQPPTSVIGVIEYRTNWGLDITHDHEQLLIKPNNDHLRIEALYEPLKEGTLLPSQTACLFCDRWTGDGISFHACTYANALKDCDVVVHTYDETYEPIRGMGEEGDSDVEQWIYRLQAGSLKYKAKRSGGVHSKYYRGG